VQGAGCGVAGSDLADVAERNGQECDYRVDELEADEHELRLWDVSQSLEFRIYSLEFRV